MSNSNFGKLLK